jgi:hypothetical protein
MSGPAEPCERCDDSGYVETFHGGIWTGQSVRSSLAICDCICGEDVRRERSVRRHLLENGNG